MKRTDLRGLEALALAQGGYFSRGDAARHGIGRDLLYYHVRSGRFERVFPGVYRHRMALETERAELFLPWVWSDYRGVLSHETALDLYGLSDVMPNRVHLTVPPNFVRPAPGYVLHRARLEPEEVTEYEGLPVTAPARTIVDAAAAGTGPEQIELAVRQAIARGLTTAVHLRAAAARRRYRNRRTVLPMIEEFVRRAAA
jgi:predicted transcriptional regulator of viral defense system